MPVDRRRVPVPRVPTTEEADHTTIKHQLDRLTEQYLRIDREAMLVKKTLEDVSRTQESQSELLQQVLDTLSDLASGIEVLQKLLQRKPGAIKRRRV